MSRRHTLPAEVYALVEHHPSTVLLECGFSHNQYSSAETGAQPQLFVDPLHVCVAYTPTEIPRLFADVEGAVAAGHTAVGYFTYESGNCFEPKAGLRPLQAGQPLAWFGIYERCYTFDYATGTYRDGAPPQLERIRNAMQPEMEAPCGDAAIGAAFGLTQERYSECIAAIHEWIRAGDVYQLNFTVPYAVKQQGSFAAMYAALRARQPVEYGAFIHAQPEHRILSFSPELFFSIDEQNGGRSITTRPMKGTAARGRTSREDRVRAEWLRNDPKNRAENLMIVDLLRNDLGRLAKFGTVHAEKLFAVERYPTLWQMTSTVTAELRSDVRYSEIFRALFPCGSITGAPKVRAMQLLTQLEEKPRGIYTGAIGVFSPHRAVFNVAIRTLEMSGNEGTMGVGSGIVIDSVAEEEYAECLLKAQFLGPQEHRSTGDRLLDGSFSLIETMLWDGGFPLIELHLDRFADSADYFGLPFERMQVKAKLESHAETFAAVTPRRVRLLLGADGEFSISSVPFASSSPNSAVRVCIAAERTNSADKWLYHKTTHREEYARAHKQAVEKGYDDVLFLNERCELTEGAISSVFIEKNGRMLTPPVECGLLPGVYRRHLLSTRPDTEECVLTLDDLRSADAVYICNAVRGLRKVRIDW